MPRAVWTGSISFGLVNVPVKAFTAVRDHDVHVNQLEKGTGARIRYQKVSEKTGDEVAADDIELGYEVSDRRYVTLDRGELDELQPETARTIEVTDFVALAEVDRSTTSAPTGSPRPTTRPRSPTACSSPPWRTASASPSGTVVMRNKQYLTAVRPLDGALAMSTMRFADEVVPRSDIDGLPTRRTKPDATALRLATQIVDSLEAPWKPEQYEDTYTAELERIIRAKDKGEDVVVEASPAATADVVDLMAALEASVDAARSGRGRRGRASALRKAAEELAAAAAAEADEQPAKRKGGTGRQAGRPKKRA